MKVIKESINNLPEVDKKAQVVIDPVMGKAKVDSEENQTEFDRKKAFTSGEHQPKPEEAEQELKKINLDESLFNEDIEEDLIDAVNEIAENTAFIQNTLDDLENDVQQVAQEVCPEYGSDYTVERTVDYSGEENDESLDEGIATVAAALGTSAAFVAKHWDEILNGFKELGIELNDFDSNIVDILKRHKDLKSINTNDAVNESLNEGKEIVAVADLVKAAKEVLFMQPWKTKEVLSQNQNILRDYLNSGLSAKDYLQKQFDYYGPKYADWFAAGGPTKYVQNFAEGLSDDQQQKISQFVESLNKQIEEGYLSVPEFIDQDMPNGNAFWIMGYCANAMQECGLGDEVAEMQERAMSGNYDNLCAVCDEYIQRCNDMANDYDDEFDYDVDTKDIAELDDPDFYTESFQFRM